MIKGNYESVYEPKVDQAEGLQPGVSIYDHKYPKDGTQWIFGDTSGEHRAEASGSPEHPNPFHVFQLWRVYRQCVQPLSQLVHESAIDDIIVRCGPALSNSTSGRVDVHDHAILFAIYHSALSTMDSGEVEGLFGKPSMDMLQDFRIATRFWLRQADLYRTMDLQILQALVIFLVALDQAIDPRSMIPLIALTKFLVHRLHVHLSVGAPRGAVPTLEVDMARRLWWELRAIEERAEDRGGSMGLHLLETDSTMPLPGFLPDSDFAYHATSNVCSGNLGHKRSYTAAENTNSPKVLPLVRCELLRFGLRARRAPAERGDRPDLRLLRDLEEFQLSVQHQYLDSCADDSALRPARLWLNYHRLGTRLKVLLSQERLLMTDNKRSSARLEAQRQGNLESCVEVCEAYLDLHQDPFYRSWAGHIVSWVSALLHLFRLTRLLVVTNEALVRRAWHLIDEHYAHCFGGLALRKDPKRPGTLDQAMLAAWKDMAGLAALAGISLAEPQCVQDAIVRFENAGRAQSSTQQQQHGDHVVASSGTNEPPTLTTSFPNAVQSKSDFAAPLPNARDAPFMDELDWLFAPPQQDWSFWPDQL